MRKFNPTATRYGFNGKEKENSFGNGEGSHLDFGDRIYDARVPHLLSLDGRAKDFPWLSPYAYAANNPIKYIDKNGEGPEDPVTQTLTYYNDGIVMSELSFCGCSTGNFHLKKQYEAGKVSFKQLGAKTVYQIQNDDGTFRNVTALEFGIHNQANPEAWLDAAEWLPGGEVVEFGRAVKDKNYGQAAFVVGMAFVPFDKVLRTAGKATVWTFKHTAGKAVRFTAKQLWSKHPFFRGVIIEGIAAKTKYKNFAHMLFTGPNGAMTPYFPYFDFLKGNKAISLKTTNAKSGFGSIKKNIDDLFNFVKGSAKNGEVLINEVQVDIIVPDDYNQNLLKDVIQYGKDKGVKVKIFTTSEALDIVD